MRPCRGLIIPLLVLSTAAGQARPETRTMPDSRTQEAAELMLKFAERTGLSSDRPQRRYLWTDAFAVCNFLGLAGATGKSLYTDLALKLIDRVHHVLGRHRGDESRSGWISGLGDEAGEAHPTRGGLRIGKDLPERPPNHAFDERREWDRDGQYFHYLTRWMHALDRSTRSTGQARFNEWARELAETAYRAFTYQPPFGGLRRMYWKMSIDLKRPLVTAMGQHDPLDAYITFVQIGATATALPRPISRPDLTEETGQLAAMVEGGAWETADPLGLGGLLTDAHRVDQLQRQGASFKEALPAALLRAALGGLRHYVDSGDLELPAERRLAFRELGLSIGLHAVRLMQQAAERGPKGLASPARVPEPLQALKRYESLGDRIEAFWREPAHRSTRTWGEHQDINDVMLATRLAPEGFLVLPPIR